MVFNEVLGVDVDVPERPRRIVSFSPAATETLFEIGLGDAVVGVSAFCARPEAAKAKRKVGSYNTVRTELLRELDPELVLTATGYQRDFAVRLSKDFPVYPLELPLTVAGIVDFTVKVGLVTGAHDEARALASALLRQLSETKRVGGVKAYVEIDLGGPVSFGAFSYITDAIRVLGCSSLFDSSRTEWLTPDFTRVASLDPDLVFYEPKMFSKFGERELRGVLKDRGWDRMRAVDAGNCFVTPGPLDFLAHHGPSFVTKAMPWLAAKFAEAKENLGR